MRNQFIYHAFVLFGILSMYSCKQDENIDYPNIVYIFADDLGYGDLSCFGATDIATPNIDRIANEGIKFTSLLSASHICSPSRAALLTGRHPQRMGINDVFFADSYLGMHPEEVTIAEVLKGHGYATGTVGKWHLGHREKYLPLNQGFDSYYGIPYSNDMQSVVYMKDNEVDSFYVNQAYTTKTYTDKSLEFIRNNHDKPFFLYIPHNMPHVPIYASEDFIGTSNRGLYGDVIQEIDWSVGEIIKVLEELEELDNTLIVFSSDNGPWLVMEDHGGSSGPLREGKQFTFEGGMRVPTVAMWPKVIEPGIIESSMVLQMDWFPTIVDIVDHQLPADLIIDGESILPILKGDSERIANEYIYFDLANPQCFREGDWKVKLPYEGFRGTPWKSKVEAHDTLLFDLKSDPGETNNLFSENPEKARMLLEKMEVRYKEMGDLPTSLFIHSPEDNSHLEYLRNKKRDQK